MKCYWSEFDLYEWISELLARVLEWKKVIIYSEGNEIKLKQQQQKIEKRKVKELMVVLSHREKKPFIISPTNTHTHTHKES